MIFAEFFTIGTLAAAGTSTSRIPAPKKRNSSQLLQRCSLDAPTNIRDTHICVVNRVSQKHAHPQAASNSQPSTSGINQGTCSLLI